MAHPAMEQVEADTEMKLLEAPGHERIAVLAYTLWEARGRPDGSPEVDWFQAEQELTATR